MQASNSRTLLTILEGGCPSSLLVLWWETSLQSVFPWSLAVACVPSATASLRSDKVRKNPPKVARKIANSNRDPVAFKGYRVLVHLQDPGYRRNPIAPKLR